MKLEVKKGYKLEVTNYYYKDFIEDDWSITLIGENLDDLIKEFWEEKFVDSDIKIEYVYITKSEFVNYKGKNIELEEGKILSNGKKILNNSEYKEEALNKRKERIEKIKAEQEKYNKKEKERKELKQLKILQEKYERNPNPTTRPEPPRDRLIKEGNQPPNPNNAKNNVC